MPLPSSGIIVVEKPSTVSNTRITNNSSITTSTTNTNNPSTHHHPPPQQQQHQQQQQQTHIQYYEYYDVNENQLSQLSQQQQHHQQQQQHSTIVVDGTVYHQQQIQLGGLSASGGGGGRKSSFSSSSSSSNKSNLQTLKTGPMPQNKQYSQQQQQHIIQHTSHTNNPQQHVQQVNLATASSSQHQQQQHQQPPPTHMIQVSEEFLEQATNNHNTSNMMISTTGEVIQQQQIFKIVSTDATTGNMIIDTSNQNTHPTTPKVLLSNLTVLSKQQHQANTAHQQLLTSNQQQQQSQATGQTINFVNAKNLYTTTNSNLAASGQVKQQKFTVATTNVGNYKGSGIKQSTNTQYIQQPNTMGQQKMNITSGTRNMQMLATTRVQPAGNSLSNNNSGMISGNTAQAMILQQPQKFVSNNTNAPKTTLGTATGNVIKKSTTGTLRMNNSNNTTTTKLMNNLNTHSTQGVKTFITQTNQQQQQQMQQQNINQLTLHHATTTTKGGKSKFAKQYNNAILNSAGVVAIATLPHQPPTNTQQNMPAQSNYINHNKGGNKINKINSKYGSQTTTVAAQLPPGTQLHQKTVNQIQQQQYQSTSNSNIKFVNAQGTIIQQQQQHQSTLTTQKIGNKHQQHQQQQYQNIQNFDTVDGNHLYAATAASSSNSSASSGGSSLLTDDIMMVNGTQMTDEISARILQSMSQKSFSNQRHQQQQHQPHPPVYQKSSPITSNNNNMLPPPPTQTSHVSSNSNNNSNILLSPREYTLYPPTVAATTATAASQHNSSHQQQQSSPNQYSLSATQQISSNQITAGSFSSNYNISVSNNNMTTTITPHSTTVASLTPLSNTTAVSAGTARQIQSAPNSRSQSMERKLHETSMSRKSTEYYKANNHNSLRGSHNNLATAQSGNGAVLPAPAGIAGHTSLSSSSSSNLMGVAATQSSLPSRPPSIPPAALMEPQAQVIHLQATKTLPGANNTSNDDDDIIGEEIRPVPVETEDIRLRILHAVLFDHTYVNPMPLELPTTFAVQLPPPPNSHVSQGHMMTSPAVASTGGGGTSTHIQQWSLGGIGAVASATAVQQNYAIYGTQLSRIQHDDDSYSAINNTTRLAIGDIDPGEETETAPEAELEDDSITRCICDLTHDDGYMICCDKCCAWQHVDCMGIDRQNIPDEYLCELCQPRAVDKARARSLQLMKRKEQTQLMLSVQAQAVASAGTMGAAGSASGSIGGGANLLPNDVLAAQQRLMASGATGFNFTGNMATDAAALQLLGAGVASGATLKKGAKMLKKVKDTVAGKKSKKADKLAAAASAGLTGCKPARKETKKNTKRKKATAHESGSTVGMTASEKHAANLRQWIENYELAVTNHYSPELRARLHAITKQPSLLQSILNTENPILKEFSNGSLENRATTVPHAGGKILISNLDIIPNSPICELRGKYMLTTQYKTQNTSMNMNTPPPNNYHLASYKAHKTPGPFIFFYQLPGAEVTISCHLIPQTTTTLNPDGTYTTTTTTLPAQQSPPTYLKGPEICVDTRTYGNEARFVRRSCRPNAEIQHLFEKGTIHLFIVALTDIRASTEITIRHEPHDLLAVENKKSSSVVIQPTSTQCACGLTKDCIFGPPLPQLPPAAKSNAGRKALHFSGGGATNTGNLTAKQRKANQQNMNRNRSISSSASGDSNMGGTTSIMTTSITVPLELNSPNNVTKLTGNNKNMIHTNSLMPLTSSCNSNLSNASSTSSTLNSIIHDSGICTSSSSPSVSIPSPSPIQHIHSPIQQQQHQQAQQHQQQLIMQHTHIRPNQILPQQAQQLMQTLPTPLILATPDITTQQQPQQHQQQLVLTQHITQSPQRQQQQQSQPLTVIHQSATVVPLNTITEIKAEQPIPTTPATVNATTPQLQQHPPTPQLQLMSPQKPIPVPPMVVATVTATGLMDIVTPDATIAAAALQSLNTMQSPNVSNSNIAETVEKPQPSAQKQPQPQPQYVLMSVTEVNVENQKQQHQQQQFPQLQSLQPNQTLEHLLTGNATTTPSVSSSVSSSPQQQQKSPQKNQSHSQHNNTQPGRKTPAKNARTTSFSEDNDHHNDEHTNTQPNSSSTPKEKPKLSREDRKMEAILRAIDKMERNQQRKQEQKQTKRQNSSSQNTTPTSPNKTFDSADSSAGGGTTATTTTKRTNSHTGTRTKKKRKAGNKGGQGGSYNAQRKRRQSRNNSQESQDDCHPHEAMTSESEAALHSPPIQTLARTVRQQTFSSPSTSTANATVETNEATLTNAVDQAAGLLMAFANPNTKKIEEQQIMQLQHQEDQQQEKQEQEKQEQEKQEQEKQEQEKQEQEKQEQEKQQQETQQQKKQQQQITQPQQQEQKITQSEQQLEQKITQSEQQQEQQITQQQQQQGQQITQQQEQNHQSQEKEQQQHQQQQQEQEQQQQEQLTLQSTQTTAQYIINTNEASSPPTPPSQVSSACLLIEAAVGPLETNLDNSTVTGELNTTEFKYPLLAKTKKHLMNNWLHQTEEINPPDVSNRNILTQREQSTAIGCVTGGLNTLLQVAMSDFKETQTGESDITPEQPQNLSIVAQKVEEFIQQTESSGVGAPATAPPISKHSYKYEQHQQQQYSLTTTPAVDLSLKTLSTIPSSNMTSGSAGNKNLYLPLQVSTCSNNSSVKKRWLRQAISEETHEFFMTSMPTPHVPNGFATPLKKRRLHLPGKDELEENLLQTNTLSNPTTSTQQSQQLHSAIITHHQQEQNMEELEYKDKSQIKTHAQVPAPQETQHEDVDVDVEKCEMNDLPQNLPKLEADQEQDVDVTSFPNQQIEDDTMEHRIKTEGFAKHETLQQPKTEIKEEEVEETNNHHTQSPLEFQDQEDDVDILRSPSPGREMIKAEDNLVKIEPEDTSGTEDVKIDVEREESMAADDDDNMVTHQQQIKQQQMEEQKVQPSKENIVVKQEFQLEITKEQNNSNNSQDIATETKRENSTILDIKPEDPFMDVDDGSPKAKRPKLDEIPVNVKPEPTNQEKIKLEQASLKQEIKKTDNVCYKTTQKELINSHTSTTNKEILKTEKSLVETEVSSTISSSSSLMTAAADSTFAGVETATPPPPIVQGISASLQRHKSLSDDDIQARLHSFHKENILFLQSRNKKAKSSNSLANNDHDKNKQNSSANTSNHHHHHHHHHGHEGKKLEKSASKHHKTTSTTPTSGIGKKQKLHKRERTTSSSSSNSHKNASTTPQQSSSSTSAALNKSNLVNASTNSSTGSTKKLKSLKKSSSGSSTSSNTSQSSSSNSSSTTIQSSYPSTSSGTGEKEKLHEKEKQRQRTTSASSNSAITSSNPLTSYTQTKKRQLNFELELTKDMHLVNSISKHKRDLKLSLSLTEDGQGYVVGKKSRKDSACMLKEELKNGTNKQQQQNKLTIANAEKSMDKKTTPPSLASSASTKCQQPQQMTCSATSIEEVKITTTIVTQPPTVTLVPTPILREHPTLPHFNNVVIAANNSLCTPPPATLPPTTQQSQPTSLPPQNIPNHANSSSFIPTTTSTHHQHITFPTPPEGGSSGISSPNVNSTNHLPFYNTIYGKLLENHPTQPSLTLPTPIAAGNSPMTAITPSVLGCNASAEVTTGVLSEYQDTKLKSYNTLGGYVSHTALFGLNNTSSAVKDNIITTTCSLIKDLTNEMPAPLPPPPPPPTQPSTATVSTANTSTTCVNSATGSSSLSSTSLKILTKTASHDPRLNPHLTAPEPPPQPKRKLSINEYRKRMQQSSSSDSNSGSLSTTPTTPPTTTELSSTSASVTLTNKCTLNSPDRLTQSVDSQIQKEIMSSTPATTTTSSSHHNALESLNISNSSTSNSSLNDSLLKSSFVEEDSTKGQFNAAPTLLEKQQESLCARLKSLKEKQSLATSFSVGGCGNRSRFSSFSESVASSDFGLRKDDDDMDIIRNRNHSISSSIGGGDLLDNCLEEISSTSTSMSSSREPSPDRYTTYQKILTASAATTMTNTTIAGNSNHGQNRQQQHSTSDKHDMAGLERKKSVDIA